MSLPKRLEVSGNHLYDGQRRVATAMAGPLPAVGPLEAWPAKRTWESEEMARALCRAYNAAQERTEPPTAEPDPDEKADARRNGDFDDMGL